MDFSSKLLENAVNEVAQLPGIGRRTALRLVLHLLRQPPEKTTYLSDALINVRTKVRYCKNCHNISDTEVCDICIQPKRDLSTICVVEDIRDVMSIENTQQYKGVYHVLGGKISPVEGIGPHHLNIKSLIEKATQGALKEVIFALSSTMEGDTTNYYIYKQLIPFHLKISTISRGISIGGELEYTDEVTLGRSILHRIPFEDSLKVFN